MGEYLFNYTTNYKYLSNTNIIIRVTAAKLNKTVVNLDNLKTAVF